MMIKNNKIKNMKNLKFFTLAIAIVGFSATSFAQTNPTVSTTASAGATIIKPIAIAKNTDMNFGNVAPSSTLAGTVTLSTAGTRTNSGASLPTVAGTVAAAQFTVTGEGTSAFTISMPADNAIKLVGPGGSTVMNLTGFTNDAGGATSALVAGSKIIKVGATLNVGIAQAAGAYTADFAVTVNYN